MGTGATLSPNHITIPQQFTNDCQGSALPEWVLWQGSSNTYVGIKGWGWGERGRNVGGGKLAIARVGNR